MAQRITDPNIFNGNEVMEGRQLYELADFAFLLRKNISSVILAQMSYELLQDTANDAKNPGHRPIQYLRDLYLHASKGSDEDKEIDKYLHLLAEVGLLQRITPGNKWVITRDGFEMMRGRYLDADKATFNASTHNVFNIVN